VLASLATTRTTALLAHGEAANQALTGGYDLGFLIAAGCVAAAIVVAAVVLRPSPEEAAAPVEEPRFAEALDAA
jgi:hypothetical protein